MRRAGFGPRSEPGLFIAELVERDRAPRSSMNDGALGEPEGGRLQRRVARGLTWTVIETWGRQGINLAVFVVLARLLTPVDFGLVALAAVFVSLAQLLVDQGLGDALIQRPSLTERHLNTAFWVAISTGLLLTVAGLVLATPIAAMLGEPPLGPILQVLSLTFLLAAMSSIQIALLRRELAFAGLAVRALAAAVAGGVIGILLAVLGFGVWSLVAQQICATVVSVIVLWWARPWRPRLQFSPRHFRELFRFGIHVVGSDVLSWVTRNVDNLLIGAVLGTTQLGLYAVGYRILTMTQTMLLNVASKIAFPAFARLQGEPDRIRQAYFRVTRVASVVILPGYVGLALVAPELTVVLFGAQWEESGPVAAVLFLIGPLVALQGFSGSLLNAVGRPDIVFRFRLITSVTNVIGFIIAVSFGILAVAVAYVVRGYLLAPLMLRWMRRHAGVPIGESLAQLRGTAVASGWMAAVVLAVKLLLADTTTSAGLLVIEVASAVATFVAVLMIAERSLLGEALEVGRQAMSMRSRRYRAQVDSTRPAPHADEP